MSTVRRPKTAFTNDAQTTKFLYLILKQLDLKTINWQEVADNIGIKNGHAARMRWSRFKQHAEGTPPQPKQTKAKKTDGEKGKGKRDREDADLSKENDGRDEKRVKLESGFSPAAPPHGYSGFNDYTSMPFSIPHAMSPVVKQEALIKSEPGLGHVATSMPNMSLTLASQHPEPCAPFSNPPAPNFTTTQDGEMDDIPIKQLVSPREATVSMADLQLKPPVKQEFQLSDSSASSIPAPSTTPDRNASSAILSPSRMNADYPVPVDSASQATEDHVAPQRDSTPASFPESMTLPSHAPAWNHPSSLPPSGHGLPFSPWPPLYRPYPHAQQYQQPFGHAPPYGMGYQQRPMMPPFGHMSMYQNYTPPFAQQGGQQQMFTQGPYQPMPVPPRAASPGGLSEGFSSVFDAAHAQDDMQQSAGECKNSILNSAPVEAPILESRTASASTAQNADKYDERSKLDRSKSALPSGFAEQKSKSAVFSNPGTKSQVTASPSRTQRNTPSGEQQSHETIKSAPNAQPSATSCSPPFSATSSSSNAARSPDVPSHPAPPQDAAHGNDATSPGTKKPSTKPTAEYENSTAVEDDAWLLDADFDFDLDGLCPSLGAGSSSTAGLASGSSTAPTSAPASVSASSAAAGDAHQSMGSLIFSIPGLAPASRSIPTSAPTSAPTSTSMANPAATPSPAPTQMPAPTNPPTLTQTSTSLPVSQPMPTPARMPLQPQYLIPDDVIIMESMTTSSRTNTSSDRNNRV